MITPNKNKNYGVADYLDLAQFLSILLQFNFMAIENGTDRKCVFAKEALV